MRDLAALYGIRCIPHSWNSAITAAASAHVASLLPEPTLMPGNDVPVMEYDTTENLLISELLMERVPERADIATISIRPCWVQDLESYERNLGPIVCDPSVLVENFCSGSRIRD